MDFNYQLDLVQTNKHILTVLINYTESVLTPTKVFWTIQQPRCFKTLTNKMMLWQTLERKKGINEKTDTLDEKVWNFFKQMRLFSNPSVYV